MCMARVGDCHPVSHSCIARTALVVSVFERSNGILVRQPGLGLNSHAT
jgi:hypothetical protein